MNLTSAVPPMLLALAGAVVAAGFASAWSPAHRRRQAATLKMAAGTGYLLLAWQGGATDTPYGRVLLAGLALCWLGDLLLIPGGDGPAFLGGLGSFLLGHVAFAAAFVTAGVTWSWTTAALVPAAGVALGILRWLWSAGLSRRMRGPVVAYVVAITAMVSLAWGAAGAGASWLIPVGAVAFMASDVFVARERFVRPSRWNTRLGLPLYFLAQALLALSV